MTDYYDETHYQLALTNRQVLTAFVILLICLFVAFFAGVRIGRSSGDVVIATAGLGDPEAAGLATDAQRSDAEFEFFGPDATATRAGTDDEVTGGSITKPQKRRRDRADGLGTLAGERRRAAADDTNAPEVMRGRRSQAVVVRRDDETVDEPAAAQGGSVFQVFSGVDKGQANTLTGRLESAGYRAFISEVEIEGQPHYRVRVGPFPSREETAARAEDLESELGLDTWIPPTEP